VMPHDITAEDVFEHLYEIKHYSGEVSVAPYWKFSMSGDTYYLTCSGFLYRKEPGTEGLGGFFCGTLVDGVFYPRTDA
jgi:hypothetical protein